MPKSSKKSTSKKATGAAGAAKALSKKPKEALKKMKMEAANEVGVDLKKGGELSSKQAGSVGGQMVKKMVQSKGKK